jgi:hypothetical protein
VSQQPSRRLQSEGKIDKAKGWHIIQAGMPPAERGYADHAIPTRPTFRSENIDLRPAASTLHGGIFLFEIPLIGPAEAIRLQVSTRLSRRDGHQSGVRYSQHLVKPPY